MQWRLMQFFYSLLRYKTESFSEWITNFHIWTNSFRNTEKLFCCGWSQWILNKIDLQNMHWMMYILRLSCARTLACRDKTTVCAFLQNLRPGYFSTERGKKSLSLVFPKIPRDFWINGSRRSISWPWRITNKKNE